MFSGNSNATKNVFGAPQQPATSYSTYLFGTDATVSKDSSIFTRSQHPVNFPTTSLFNVTQASTFTDPSRPAPGMFCNTFQSAPPPITSNALDPDNSDLSIMPRSTVNPFLVNQQASSLTSKQAVSSHITKTRFSIKRSAVQSNSESQYQDAPFGPSLVDKGKFSLKRKDELDSVGHSKKRSAFGSGSAQDNDDITQLSTLLVKRIPEKFANKQNLNAHFGKFGIVRKVTLSQARDGSNIAYIYFSDHNSADHALRNGAEISLGCTMKIFWKRPVTKKIVDVADLPVTKPAVKSSQKDVFGLTVGKAVTSSMADSNEILKKPVLSALPLAIKSIDCETLAAAQCNKERLDILMRRDQAMRERLKLNKNRDISGVCHDMCPEAERYIREDRRRLSIYEMIEGTANSGFPLGNHQKMVKEYDRSAADKGLPLPIELRSLPALVYTMDYLLNRVIDDISPDQVCDWYDFIWNRTRAIRKDITQLRMSDTISASLVEKCARFHICCSHELCDQPVAVYDEKINSENLTKCLETLKQMYQDVEGCVNEPEFRCYQILLNMNDDDIQWEVQQFQLWVRQSQQVQHAVKIYQALQANNYVRFFRLVRKSSYLQLCILLRYFNQVRYSAIKVMMMSHSDKSKHFSFDAISDILGFDSVSSMADFCKHYSIHVVGSSINISKSQFVEPDAKYPIMKSAMFVSAKQSYNSIGEIVNGAPLLPFVIRDPYSSFDGTGEYLGDKKLLSPSPTCEKQLMFSSVAADPSSRVASDHDVLCIAEGIITEVGDEFISGSYEDVLEELKAQSVAADHVADQLIADSIRSEVGYIFAELLEVSTMKSKVLDLISVEELELIIDSVLETDIEDVACEEMVIVDKQANELRRSRCINLICETVICEEILLQSLDLFNQFYETNVVAVLSRLAETEKMMHCKLMRKCFNRWTDLLSRREKRRNCILNFPPTSAIRCFSPDVLDRSMDPDKMESINIRRCNDWVLHKANEIYKERYSSRPLELARILRKNDPFPIGDGKGNYVKLVLVYNQLSDVVQWAVSKLGGDPALIGQSLYSILNVDETSTPPVCVSAVALADLCESGNIPKIKGVTGFIVITDSESSLNLFERVCSCNTFGRIPMLVLTCNNSFTDVSENRIAKVTILRNFSADFQDCQNFVQGLDWLIEKAISVLPSSVHSTNLLHLLQDAVYIHLTCKFVDKTAALDDMSDMNVHPRDMVCLYNKLLWKLVDIVTNEELQNLNWPPHELQVHAEQLQHIPSVHWPFHSKIANLISKLILPEFSEFPIQINTSFVEKFVDQIPGIDSNDHVLHRQLATEVINETSWFQFIMCFIDRAIMCYSSDLSSITVWYFKAHLNSMSNLGDLTFMGGSIKDREVLVKEQSVFRYPSERCRKLFTSESYDSVYNKSATMGSVTWMGQQIIEDEVRASNKLSELLSISMGDFPVEAEVFEDKTPKYCQFNQPPSVILEVDEDYELDSDSKETIQERMQRLRRLVDIEMDIEDTLRMQAVSLDRGDYFR